PSLLCSGVMSFQGSPLRATLFHGPGVKCQLIRSASVMPKPPLACCSGVREFQNFVAASVISAQALASSPEGASCASERVESSERTSKSATHGTSRRVMDMLLVRLDEN